MRVLFASSEIFPLIKTGGLADVSGALPPALAELGLDVRLLMPGYPQAMARLESPHRVASLGSPLGAGEAHLVEGRLPGTDVPVWLIDCPAQYQRDGGPYQDQWGNDWFDNGLRFGLLSWTAAALSRDWSPFDWRPDVIHCNDWQTGLAPAYLQAWGGPRPGTVMTIHNIAYQGGFPGDLVGRLDLPATCYQPEGLEYYGRMSFLKAGLFYSDKLTTVSPTYARQIQSAPQGFGMEGLLAHRRRDLIGILNGVDYGVWNPATDPHLLRPYGADLQGKAEAKAALEAELGLDQDDSPLFVIVSRLNDHKGMDLVLAAIPFLLRHGGKLALLGTGERWMEDGFRAVAAQHPSRIAAHIGYDETMAHRLIAGGDVLLMPSRSEPCGLTQLYALQYGTVPLVHETGGLADTVVDVAYDTMLNGSATGFAFKHADLGGLEWCIERVVQTYRNTETWARIRAAGPRQDFSWHRAAERYRDLYAGLLPEE
jgi:starch synthase